MRDARRGPSWIAIGWLVLAVCLASSACAPAKEAPPNASSEALLPELKRLPGELLTLDECIVRGWNHPTPGGPEGEDRPAGGHRAPGAGAVPPLHGDLRGQDLPGHPVGSAPAGGRQHRNHGHHLGLVPAGRATGRGLRGAAGVRLRFSLHLGDPARFHPRSLLPGGPERAARGHPGGRPLPHPAQRPGGRGLPQGRHQVDDRLHPGPGAGFPVEGGPGQGPQYVAGLTHRPGPAHGRGSERHRHPLPGERAGGVSRHHRREGGP